MSEWKTYKLGDLINVKHGFAFKGEYFSEEPTSNILLTPGNFHIGGGFKSDKFKYYDGEIPEEYILREGDIIISMTDLSKAGDTLGYAAKIPQHSDIAYLHNQRLGLVELKNDAVDCDFLYWILRTKPYHYYIVGSATGSTVKHTSPTRICDYEFPAPKDKAVQQQIAEILSSLDDKIELNLQMNQTLETMAQALFKEWFVDKADSNWETVHLGDLIEIKGGYSYKGKDVGTGDAFLLGMGCVSFNDRFLPSGARPYPEYSTNNHFVNPGDIVLATRQQSDNLPILGFPARIPSSFKDKKVIVGTNLYRVVNNSKINESILFQLFRSDSYRHHIIANSKGTTVKMITKDSVELFEFKVPPTELVQKYGKILETIDFKIEENTIQIQTLTQLRNTLLPKLMSGEIKVS